MENPKVDRNERDIKDLSEDMEDVLQRLSKTEAKCNLLTKLVWAAMGGGGAAIGGHVANQVGILG